MHPLFVEELPYDPNQVTPGVIGFAVTALVAVAVMLLMWDFNRRVRRINDREEARERLLAEVAESQRGQGAAEDGPSEDADGGRAPAPVEPLEADGDGAGPAR